MEFKYYKISLVGEEYSYKTKISIYDSLECLIVDSRRENLGFIQVYDRNNQVSFIMTDKIVTFKEITEEEYKKREEY